MKTRTWVWIGLLLAAGAGLWSCAAPAPTVKEKPVEEVAAGRPVADPNEVLSYEGFSLRPPGGAGDGWSYLDVTKMKAPVLPNSRRDVAFGRSPAAGAAGRGAALVEVSTFDAAGDLGTPEKVAAYTEQHLKAEMERTSSLQVLDFWVVPEDTDIAACAGYSVMLQDGPVVRLRRGVWCAHPGQPGRMVVLEANERYPEGEDAAVPDERFSAFIQSLRFGP